MRLPERVQEDKDVIDANADDDEQAVPHKICYARLIHQPIPHEQAAGK